MQLYLFRPHHLYNTDASSLMMTSLSSQSLVPKGGSDMRGVDVEEAISELVGIATWNLLGYILLLFDDEKHVLLS